MALLTTPCFRCLYLLIATLYNSHYCELRGGRTVVEEILRAHRDAAIKLLKENRAQSREGIEVLVRERLPKIAHSLQGSAALTAPQVEALYQEVLDLSFVMFSLGFTLAHTIDQPKVRA